MAEIDHGGSSAAPILVRLADWTTTVDLDALAPQALKLAKLLLLDTIGCGLAGWREETAADLVEAVTELGGAPRCQVIGRSLRTSPVNAVLANGMLVRVLDLNDYTSSLPSEGGELGGHPSDNIPVALAAGEFGNRSGRALLEAIVLGYEVFSRASNMIARGGHWDRASASAIVAPVVAGRLLGLESKKLAHGLALSVTRSATSALVRTGDISTAKSLANALVAQNGYQSVVLAAKGLTGPLAILEHPKGMGIVFSDLDSHDDLVAPLPGDLHITKARIKAYPCVATAQSLASAAIALHAKIATKLDQITTIDVKMADYPVIRRHQSDRVRLMPKSREAADHSFPFVTVSGLLNGCLGLEQFEGEPWQERKVMALMQSVTLGTDAELNARSTAGYPARITVTCSDGQCHTSEALEPPGGGNEGLDADAVIEKFQRVTDGLIRQSAGQRILETIMDLEHEADCAALADAVSADVAV